MTSMQRHDALGLSFYIFLLIVSCFYYLGFQPEAFWVGALLLVWSLFSFVRFAQIIDRMDGSTVKSTETPVRNLPQNILQTLQGKKDIAITDETMRYMGLMSLSWMGLGLLYVVWLVLTSLSVAQPKAVVDALSLVESFLVQTQSLQTPLESNVTQISMLLAVPLIGGMIFGLGQSYCYHHIYRKVLRYGGSLGLLAVMILLFLAGGTDLLVLKPQTPKMLPAGLDTAHILVALGELPDDLTPYTRRWVEAGIFANIVLYGLGFLTALGLIIAVLRKKPADTNLLSD